MWELKALGTDSRSLIQKSSNFMAFIACCIVHIFSRAYENRRIVNVVSFWRQSFVSAFKLAGLHLVEEGGLLQLSHTD